MVSFNKALVLMLAITLLGASANANRRQSTKRNNILKSIMSGGLPFPISNPYDAMGQLLQEFLAKQDCISNIILGTEGESISASAYGSLVIDLGLISFQTYGKLDVVEQIIKNTEISNPGLVKEFAKDLGISTNAQTANVEDFAQNLANYVSALIQVIGRNDYNDIPSNSQIFEDEVIKEAQTLGLTVKFAGENANDAENVLTVPENFPCKTVEQFKKSIAKSHSLIFLVSKKI